MLSFIEYLLCSNARYLLSNLTHKGLWKSDCPHVTDEEEEAHSQHVVQAPNHCVILPPAEHLLSAGLFEKKNSV